MCVCSRLASGLLAHGEVKVAGIGGGGELDGGIVLILLLIAVLIEDVGGGAGDFDAEGGLQRDGDLVVTAAVVGGDVAGLAIEAVGTFEDALELRFERRGGLGWGLDAEGEFAGGEVGDGVIAGGAGEGLKVRWSEGDWTVARTTARETGRLVSSFTTPWRVED